MNWFSKLFSPDPRKTREDQTFGHLEYEGGMWINPKGLNGEGPMIVIYALIEGPSQQQRDFYLQLQPRLDGLCDAARAFLKISGMLDFNPANLSLYSIEIPENEVIANDAFLLEFTDEEANTVFGVGFEKGIPKTSHADD